MFRKGKRVYLGPTYLTFTGNRPLCLRLGSISYQQLRAARGVATALSVRTTAPRPKLLAYYYVCRQSWRHTAADHCFTQSPWISNIYIMDTTHFHRHIVSLSRIRFSDPLRILAHRVHIHMIPGKMRENSISHRPTIPKRCDMRRANDSPVANSNLI